jgi:hypothetical protein
MAYRYLVRGPRIFGLLGRIEIAGREPALEPIRRMAAPSALPAPAARVAMSNVLPFPHQIATGTARRSAA